MIKYRLATIDDADMIAELLSVKYRIPSVKNAKDVYLKEKLFDRFTVAEQNGKIVGLVSWLIYGELRHELIRIRRLAVHDNPKSKEIAEELIRLATDDADKELKMRGFEIRKLFALVHSNDTVRKQFFESLGFELEATLKEHYSKDYDEHVMSIFFN